MKEEIIIAGFGGQGVLSMGKILCYAGLMSGKEVTWFPSYGPEQRGGTCNVTVILSDEKISSPVLRSFDTAIVLNQQSMDKFEPLVRKGGTILYDPHSIKNGPKRKDVSVYTIDAMNIAAEMKNSKAVNMLTLGAFLKAKPIVEIEDVIVGLKKSLPERHHKLIPMNEEALKNGSKFVKKLQ